MKALFAGYRTSIGKATDNSCSDNVLQWYGVCSSDVGMPFDVTDYSSRPGWNGIYAVGSGAWPVMSGACDTSTSERVVRRATCADRVHFNSSGTTLCAGGMSQFLQTWSLATIKASWSSKCLSCVGCESIIIIAVVVHAVPTGCHMIAAIDGYTVSIRFRAS